MEKLVAGTRRDTARWDAVREAVMENFLVHAGYGALILFSLVEAGRRRTRPVRTAGSLNGP
jgi:hypothetical protein